MKRFFCVFAAAILAVMVFAPVITAQADVAPPPVPNGTNIQPGQEQTQVRMVSEQVVLDVAAQSIYDNGQAAVTATFQMRNLGSAVEQMQVRFPLCSGYSGDDQVGCMVNKPIQDLGARVDGVPQTVQNTIEQLTYLDGTSAKVPTWANFPVTFPPGKDVTIQVRYTQVGYNRSGPGYSELNYVLATGAAWKDTIGAADIIIRLPMQADAETVYDYAPNADNLKAPNHAELVDNEIRIHLEDFEPAAETQMVSATVMQPKVWQKIQTESKAVAANPQDGEAWGRLGKAYKAAVMMEKGHLRGDKAGEAMYWKSFDAYQKAVELLPKDADWHYGFAELLVSNLFFNNYLRDGENIQSLQVQTIQQIKQALDINPKHAGALQLLQAVAQDGLVDASGPQPVYWALTATPTLEVYPTQAPTVTSQPTATVKSTSPPTPAPTETLAPAATVAAAVQATPTPTAGRAKTPGLCGSALIPGLMVAVVLLKRYRTLGGRF